MSLTPPPIQPLGSSVISGISPAPASILTIGLEDYYHVGAFNKFVQKNQWYRFDSRLELSTSRTLEILRSTNTKATFFVLGWIAQRFPELLRKLTDAGHEVGIKGYYHRSIREMTPEEFENDCLRAKEAVEIATGREVLGYRLADGWFKPDDLWALDSLAKLGFAYDSSIARMSGDWSNERFRDQIHQHQSAGHSLWEVPISTGSVLGWRIPVLGGNYWRQLPNWVAMRAMKKWQASHNAPLVAYFHVWELDPEQPRLSIGSRLTHLRHYRNLDKMADRLTNLLQTNRFTSIEQVLQLQAAPRNPDATPLPLWSSDSGGMPRPLNTIAFDGSKTRTPVSLVVPCYNEEALLPKYLQNSLQHVETHLTQAGYDVEFVLVDDGSSDQTWERLQEAFGGKSNFVLHRHDVNLGVAAAIVSGLRLAHTEIVCSMDCDCSYDPLELLNMIPKLQPGVDMVTASPYHADGHVRNVPGWRLTLSRGASWLYRRVLRTKLQTYTSCFRVYRRSNVANIRLRYSNFLGIAEQLGRLDLAGGTIVEHPATLEVRMLGRSKMKTVRTIFGHIGLMARLLVARLFPSKIRKRDEVIRSVITSHLENKNVLIRDHSELKSLPKPDEDIRKLVVQTRSVVRRT
jgi:polysaccharide deacetylase family protein (PEP-CTERM system associated)